MSAGVSRRCGRCSPWMLDHPRRALVPVEHPSLGVPGIIVM